jgi:hypothetical protein
MVTKRLRRDLAMVAKKGLSYQFYIYLINLFTIIKKIWLRNPR